MILLPDVEMWELIQIFITKIKAEWEDLAYCMRYKPEDIQAFRRDSQNLQECCKKLFENWLTTSHGPIPKTYQTLLNHIREVDRLAAVSEAIEKELTEGSCISIEELLAILAIIIIHNYKYSYIATYIGQLLGKRKQSLCSYKTSGYIHKTCSYYVHVVMK